MITARLRLLKHMTISGRIYFRSQRGKYFCNDRGEWYQTCKQGEPQEPIYVVSQRFIRAGEQEITFKYSESTGHENQDNS